MEEVYSALDKAIRPAVSNACMTEVQRLRKAIFMAMPASVEPMKAAFERLPSFFALTIAFHLDAICDAASKALVKL